MRLPTRPRLVGRHTPTLPCRLDACYGGQGTDTLWPHGRQPVCVRTHADVSQTLEMSAAAGRAQHQIPKEGSWEGKMGWGRFWNSHWACANSSFLSAAHRCAGLPAHLTTLLDPHLLLHRRTVHQALQCPSPHRGADPSVHLLPGHWAHAQHPGCSQRECGGAPWPPFSPSGPPLSVPTPCSQRLSLFCVPPSHNQGSQDSDRKELLQGQVAALGDRREIFS